jgi:hypothetical protein
LVDCWVERELDALDQMERDGVFEATIWPLSASGGFPLQNWVDDLVVSKPSK